MDKWQTRQRIEEIRSEIAEILEADRIYKKHITHSREEIAEHQRRQRRLQDIIIELDRLTLSTEQ